MELILAKADGQEERRVWNNLDMETGGENDFELAVPYAEWDGSIAFDKLLYIPGTEFGGIIKEIETQTSTDTILARGFTWRGYLAHRIIEPPAGSDYKIVSGELNSVISSLLGSSLGTLFRVSTTSTGKSVSNYQFERYTTLEAGLTKMLATKGYKLHIEYKQTETGGYVELSAVERNDYGDQIEISQDAQLDFTSHDYRRGINHLICLGIGELSERVVVHLYADANGAISQTKSITGLNEIVDVFENTAAEEDMLIETGIERFKTLINYKNSEITTQEMLQIDADIGDTITSRDYITGTVVTKPITRKILKIEGGIEHIEYKVEDES